MDSRIKAGLPTHTPIFPLEKPKTTKQRLDALECRMMRASRAYKEMDHRMTELKRQVNKLESEKKNAYKQGYADGFNDIIAGCDSDCKCDCDERSDNV